MTKLERERIAAEWRGLVQPLIDAEKTTQVAVANTLSGLTGRRVDQSVVSKWLGGVTPQEANMDAIRTMLKLVKNDAWPSPDVDDAAGATHPYNEAREEEELARVGQLPDALLRVMERESIAAVIRAQGMRDVCRAARIEAEKAPARAVSEERSIAAAELIVRRLMRMNIQNIGEDERRRGGDG